MKGKKKKPRFEADDSWFTTIYSLLPPLDPTETITDWFGFNSHPYFEPEDEPDEEKVRNATIADLTEDIELMLQDLNSHDPNDPSMRNIDELISLFYKEEFQDDIPYNNAEASYEDDSDDIDISDEDDEYYQEIARLYSSVFFDDDDADTESDTPLLTPSDTAAQNILIDENTVIDLSDLMHGPSENNDNCSSTMGIDPFELKNSISAPPAFPSQEKNNDILNAEEDAIIFDQLTD
ncbi:MAG: hypothetical protein IJ192_04575 [Clostridia bacterium]|nr:hypothetical protein [Clostridia bacterium]